MKFFFFLLPFVFFLQTRIPIANQFHGNDYEIIFVYVRDIIVLGFTGLGVYRHGRPIWNWILQLKWFLVWFCLLFLFSVLSSVTAIDPVVALYKTIMLLLYATFAVTIGWYIRTQHTGYSWSSVWILPFVCIAIMAAYEMSTGQSMGLWLLGNWDFSVLTPGIARAQFLGQTILRPYTVFPHPNVLGGVALIFAVLFITLLAQSERKSRVYIGILCTWFLVLISFSRSAWIAGVMGLLFTLLVRRRKTHIPRLMIALGCMSLLIIIPYISQVSVHEPAISERVELIDKSIDMIQENPLLGVGNGNFTLALKELRPVERQLFLQPVHVVWLLVASELGIVAGIIYFVGWAGLLGYALRIMKNVQAVSVAAIWGIIGIISLADHYWWSLPVGNATWWLVLGISLSMIQSEQSL